MAGLAGLLGGYGSDDDDDEQQEQQESGAPLLPGIPSAPSGSLSPAAAAAAATTAADQQDTEQQQQGTQPPLRIIDGPSTNPEPPPEGLSPPLNRDPMDSNMGSELGEEALPAALYALPSELRDPPPGEPDPVVQEQLEKYLGWVRSGRSVMSELRKDRRWQNPKFLQKTVEYFGLQQYGTCLSTEVWDPATIPDDDMWPALQQQLEAKKRRRGEQVKFQSSGQPLPPAGPGQQLPPAGPGQAAAAAAVALASHPGAAGGGAPKVVSLDPRAAAAQAQTLANSLAAGAKKSKWDK